MNLDKLLDWSYLFYRLPPAGFSWGMRIFLLIIFIGALILAIMAGIKYSKKQPIVRKFWRKIQVWGWSTSLMGLLLFYFREVRAIYLSSRAWMFIWLIIALVWLVFIIVYLFRVIPKKQEAKKSQEDFDKWLPKKK
jgi:hypothetical protein